MVDREAVFTAAPADAAGAANHAATEVALSVMVVVKDGRASSVTVDWFPRVSRRALVPKILTPKQFDISLMEFQQDRQRL